ncbi:MAG: hypothetical protein HKN26_15450, partial [Acidimicrobiales bacterium]|nr:hypothetical protein [Acidimicrobiales bacterium]
MRWRFDQYGVTLADIDEEELGRAVGACIGVLVIVRRSVVEGKQKSATVSSAPTGCHTAAIRLGYATREPGQGFSCIVAFEGTAGMNERERLKLYDRLGEVLGPDEAGTLMELLPPDGWDDIATKQLVGANATSLRGEMAEVRGEMAEVRGEMAEVRGEMAEVRGEM